jgi:hypothetical protein
MNSERRSWKRWRDVTFAGCTAWLVLQNTALLTLLTWARPGRVLAAGTEIARTALAISGQIAVLALAATLGLALAAWLVRAPGGLVPDSAAPPRAPGADHVD